ncbi:hypothetical protein Gotur_006898 [Gossypium turneri]
MVATYLQLWSRSYLSIRSQSDMLVNNLSKCFNKVNPYLLPILPPTLRRPLGRRTKVRRKEPDKPKTTRRLSKRKVDIMRSKYNKIGHNKRCYKREAG